MSTAFTPVAFMKRYEIKYLINESQRAYLERELEGRLFPDRYGETTIASLYYDTPDFRLVRASLDRPAYKEKLRLRSYGPASDTSPVFLEMKRKADGVVYKRRVQTTVPQADRFIAGDAGLDASGQISAELTGFRDHYGSLQPACLIVYERIAYYESDGDLRLTMDRNPRYRMDDPVLGGSADGEPLLPAGYSILEVKVQQSMPLWLAGVLSRGNIYKSSFSKYGEAYRRESNTNYYGVRNYV